MYDARDSLEGLVEEIRPVLLAISLLFSILSPCLSSILCGGIVYFFIRYALYGYVLETRVQELTCGFCMAVGLVGLLISVLMVPISVYFPARPVASALVRALPIMNSIRELLGMSPLYTLPDGSIYADDRNTIDHAYSLLSEIKEALKHNRRIELRKKSSLKQQTRQMLDNMVTLLWTLSRIRRVKTVVSCESQAEVKKLEKRLLTEMKHSLETLDAVLVSITKLEIVSGDETIDRLLKNLNESNMRLRDLADAYEEVKNEWSLSPRFGGGGGKSEGG